MEFIEKLTENAGEIQTRVLAEILLRNSNVEYLKRHGLDGHTDTEAFKKVVPVISYEDIQPDIKRIANGDSSPILCCEPISEFLKSSGTSGGERKLVPMTGEELRRRESFKKLSTPVMTQCFPGIDRGKAMYFLFVASESKTPSGLLARQAITSSLRNSDLKDGPHNPFTSPRDSFLCEDYFQSVYSQMLCGLCQNKQVLRAGAIFAAGFIRAIRFLEEHWSLLCNDIRTGSVNSSITDPLVREAVMRILRPDPELADFIESECRKDSWQGIIPRLWPNTKYIDVIVTGTMSQYVPTIDYYGNGLPLVSTLYGSSECYFGINLNPLSKPSDVSYTFIPTMAYFEFLPVNENNGGRDEVTDSTSVPKSLDGEEQQELVDLVNVKLGHEYEVVVTTYAGLYRYRVGDVLRVAGFKNNAPQFNFVCRKNVLLSIDSDKTDEVELQNAVKKAASHLIPFNICVADYTSYADTTQVPGHYVLYWELSQNELSNPVPPTVFQDCCFTIEESFASTYRQHRNSKTISPLEIRIVEAGTFDKIMDYAISLGASNNQYKTPRCVKSEPIIELLNTRVMSCYFSPKCPQWTPQWNYKN
ncbi:indole-3-acetic acid-amido synthetase GH3.6-like [Primulina huaijiensis]|uniref:indole-3-acetic acid-amido synthetase GH3.6-like n=1 Tax=Primulina huaijiensis TaxID=1492673 RepID=UPI003CC6F19B